VRRDVQPVDGVCLGAVEQVASGFARISEWKLGEWKFSHDTEQ
jgi:hypothetical protein